MNACIIGSFQKYYDEILKVIEYFNSNGIDILSPKSSFIVKNEEGFVILGSDYSELRHEEIQLMVFHKMYQSDFIYIWNPSGYIGKTTCYEIGKAEGNNIPIYFKENPIDLPIFISQDAVISPEELCEYIVKNHEIPPLNYNHEGLAYKLSQALRKGIYFREVEEVYNENCNIW